MRRLAITSLLVASLAACSGDSWKTEIFTDPNQLCEAAGMPYISSPGAVVDNIIANDGNSITGYCLDDIDGRVQRTILWKYLPKDPKTGEPRVVFVREV